ncbi:MAG TPA: DUF4404 family protein [Woeseiaceae bacterium]|nr:DUF4404 family protein [Woeseiaceae bacterium]
MKNRNIEAMLKRLRLELRDVKNLDPDAQRKSMELHRYVDELEDPENIHFDFMRNRVKELEARFAATHPRLERIARELADALAKMGV